MMGLNIGRFPADYLMKAGEYGIGSDGEWYACTPNGYMGNLGNHEVIDNADGTITVSPSILITAEYDEKKHELWHGFLKNGVWTSC